MKTKRAVFVFCLVALFPAKQLLAQDDKTEQLAMQDYSQGEFEKALALYEKLFNRNPDELNYYQHYLDCLLSTKDFKTAEKLTKKQVRRNPQELQYRVSDSVTTIDPVLPVAMSSEKAEIRSLMTGSCSTK